MKAKEIKKIKGVDARAVILREIADKLVELADMLDKDVRQLGK